MWALRGGMVAVVSFAPETAEGRMSGVRSTKGKSSRRRNKQREAARPEPNTPKEKEAQRSRLRRLKKKHSLALKTEEKDSKITSLQATVHRTAREVKRLSVGNESDNIDPIDVFIEPPVQPESSSPLPRPRPKYGDMEEGGCSSESPSDIPYHDYNAELNKDFFLCGTNDSRCMLLTGLVSDQFLVLIDLATPFVDETTTLGEKRERKRPQSPLRLSIPNTILLTLVWLRFYHSQRYMAHLYSVPRRYVAKALRLGMGGLSRWARELPVAEGGVGWIKDEELETFKAEQERFRYDGKDIAHVALDGMHWPTAVQHKNNNMTDAQKDLVDGQLTQLHNAKHKVYAYNILIVVDLKGRFLAFDGPYAGVEQNHLKELQVEPGVSFQDTLRRQKLICVADAGLHVESRRIDKELEQTLIEMDKRVVEGPEACRKRELQALKDAGEDRFRTLAFSVGPSLVRLTSFVMKHKDAFTDETIAFFQKIWDSTRIASRIRIIVENSVRYARRYRILKLTFRGRSTPLLPNNQYGVPMQEILQVVFVLCNFRMLRSGYLRADDWKPKYEELIVEGAKWGYPEDALNAPVLQRMAGWKIADAGAAKPLALKKAYKEAVKIYEVWMNMGVNRRAAEELELAREVNLMQNEYSSSADDGVEGFNAFVFGAPIVKPTTARAKKNAERKKEKKARGRDSTSKSSSSKKGGKKQPSKKRPKVASRKKKDSK